MERGISSRATEFAHFRGILQNSVLDGDKGTNTAYFDGVRATILYVYMISPRNTWLPLGLWQEEYWKYEAELIWNIASQFGRQTVSVSCSYRRQILHIWSGSEAIENQLLYVVNLLWNLQTGPGIWKNLPRKTVVPTNKGYFLSSSCWMSC